MGIFGSAVLEGSCVDSLRRLARVLGQPYSYYKMFVRTHPRTEALGLTVRLLADDLRSGRIKAWLTGKETVKWDDLAQKWMNLLYKGSTMQDIEDTLGVNGRVPVSVTIKWDPSARERTRQSLKKRYPHWHKSRAS